MTYGGPMLTDLELRYPFAPRSRKFFESVPVEAGLASREVVDQTESRLLNSLGRARYEPHISELVEFSSFFAAALVASQDPVLASRFSKKEAERAKAFFVREEPRVKAGTFMECYGSRLEAGGAADGRAGYSVPFEGYLSLASKYELGRNPRWKLARQELDGGVIHMGDNMLNDLFGDCALAAIAEGVRNLRRAPFPKELLGVKSEVIRYVPSPRPRTNRGYLYVETLLEHPVSDGRHRITWLILAPYCLPPDTLVAGDFNPISRISEGDRVIGLHGQHQTVSHKFSRSYSGKLAIIRASGMLPLKITPEHPILTTWTSPQGHRRGNACDVAVWKTASELVRPSPTRNGDYLLLPRVVGDFGEDEISLGPFLAEMKRPWLSQLVKLPLNLETAWLLGVYVAEGHNTSHNRTRDIAFTLSSEETEIENRLKHILGRTGLASYTVKQENKIRVVASSIALGKALDSWCGRGANRKKIPEFLLYHRNTGLLRSFLEGYMQGDGARQARPHKKVNVRSQIEGVTASRRLALQLQMAYARLGQFLSLYVRRGRRIQILGVPTLQRRQYMFVLRDNATRHRHIMADDKILVPVNSVGFVGFEGKVHNIETPDNSYAAGNLMVHNCVNVKKLDDEEAIERIRRFVSAAGETSALRRFIEYNVRRARRNGLLPPTFSRLKAEHPDIYWLLPKEVLAEETARTKGSP